MSNNLREQVKITDLTAFVHYVSKWLALGFMLTAFSYLFLYTLKIYAVIILFFTEIFIGYLILRKAKHMQNSNANLLFILIAFVNGASYAVIKINVFPVILLIAVLFGAFSLYTYLIRINITSWLRIFFIFIATIILAPIIIIGIHVLLLPIIIFVFSIRKVRQKGI